MLDCGLDINSALHFLPLPLVSSKRLSGLPTWVPRDSSEAMQLDGVSFIEEKLLKCTTNVGLCT